MKCQDKVIIVTGGGNGMGRELVLQLLKRGAKVAAIDIREDSLKAVQKEANVGDRLSIHTLDLTNKEGVVGCVGEVIAHHGQLDGVINNAGIIQPFVHIKDLDDATVDRVFSVNFYGTLHMIQACLPHLLGRPEAHILNVASMGGFLPVPGQSIYGASKAAVKLMSEGLYSELLETHVGVSVAIPGGIETEITKNSGVALETNTPTESKEAKKSSGYTLTSPADAARQMIEGIEKNKLHIYIGKDSKLMNFLMRLAPKWAIHFIQKQMKKVVK